MARDQKNFKKVNLICIITRIKPGFKFGKSGPKKDMNFSFTNIDESFVYFLDLLLVVNKQGGKILVITSIQVMQRFGCDIIIYICKQIN